MSIINNNIIYDNDIDDNDIDDNSSVLSSASTYNNISRSKQNYIYNFDENERKLKENNGKFITEYQYKIANDIYNKFYENKECVLVLGVAETQMGKTGIMQAVTREFVINDNIEPSNIYIITGLSSVEWKNQTMNRFVEDIKENIFHSNTLKKLETKLLNNENILIIIDEVHIASNIKNRIGDIFKSNGLLNINNLIERKIKILQISATPDLILSDLYKWEDNNYKLSIIKSPNNYIGIKTLLDNNQIREYKKLIDINNVIEIKKLINEKYKEPKYHLIRVNTPKLENDKINDNINKVFPSDLFLIKNYCIDNEGNKLEKDEDLNETYLNYKPEKHFIIILKEKVRCSYTINKNHIGILYERCATNQKETTIIQGFAGRACGYYDNSNKDIIVFTNIKLINDYIIKINEAHTKILYENNNKVKKTINNPDIIYNQNYTSSISSKNDNINKKFNIITISLTPDELNLLTIGVNSIEVFIDKEFNKILKKNNLFEFYNNYKNNKITTTFKLTFKSKNHNKILDTIENKTYFDYSHLYSHTSSQVKTINKIKKVIITVLNKSRNQLYLIHYDLL